MRHVALLLLIVASPGCSDEQPSKLPDMDDISLSAHFRLELGSSNNSPAPSLLTPTS